MRVAEDLLSAYDGLVAADLVTARRQIVQVDQAALEPVRVWVLLSEVRLEFSIFDNACLAGIDEEHAPGLQATLSHDMPGIDGHHARFAGHDDPVIVGDPVAAGPQTVAV